MILTSKKRGGSPSATFCIVPKPYENLSMVRDGLTTATRRSE